MSRGDAGRRWLVLLGAALALTGCRPYRVEYHHRPSFYRAGAAGQAEQPERVTLEDGTVLVFTTREPATASEPPADAGGERFRIREERSDGTVVLRAFLPRHVLANTLTALRNREYELIWEQVLAERTKRAYAARGQGYDEFSSFFEANRRELAATLTRMMLGLVRSETFMETTGDVIRFRFHPRVAAQFRFKTVEVVSEGGELKLLVIR